MIEETYWKDGEGFNQRTIEHEHLKKHYADFPHCPDHQCDCFAAEIEAKDILTEKLKFRLKKRDNLLAELLEKFGTSNGMTVLHNYDDEVEAIKNLYASEETANKSE